MSDIKELVELNNRLVALGTKHSELTWTSYTSGFDFGVVEAHKEYVAVLKDKKSYEIICNAREAAEEKKTARSRNG